MQFSSWMMVNISFFIYVVHDTLVFLLLLTH